jgi:glutathione S-transferase
MELFGTTTSPYVRRVRVVALELGVPFELVSTFERAGQERLARATPIWKVPTAILDGAVILDSHVITAQLMNAHGPGPLRPWSPDDVAQQNVMSVIDGALDALINVLYLQRDGILPESAPYLQKQRDRAASAFAWLEERLDGLSFGDERLGLSEIALQTALGWCAFRRMAQVQDYPALARFFEHHDARPSFAATRPIEPPRT